MNELLRWWTGYVGFEAEVADLTTVMEQVAQQQIQVWKLTAQGITVRGRVKAKQYRALGKIVRKHGGNIRVTSRHGFTFVRFRHRKRWGLVAGSVFMLLLLSYSQMVLWEIRLPPCDPETQVALEQLLAQYGVTVGTPLWQLNEKKIQQQLLLESEQFSWIALNFVETTVEVEYDPRVRVPTIRSEDACDIVAERAGQVTYLLASMGNETVNVGDVVLEGELLISGIVAEQVEPIAADGVVLANTVHIETRSFALQQQVPTSLPTKSDYTLYFFGLSLPIWRNHIEQDYDTVQTVNALNLFGHDLPIRWIEDCHIATVLQTVHYTEEQAHHLLAQEFDTYERENPEISFLSYREDYKLQDNTCYLTRYYQCQEDIGMKKSISVK